MESSRLRHSIRRGRDLLEIVTRPRGARPSKEEERQAAANYWQMLGHDLPLSERIERHHKLTAEAPIIQSPRRRRATGA